jgi:hypothetical protein
MSREVCEHNKEIGKYCHECENAEGSNSRLIGGLDARLKRVEAAKAKLIFEAARCLTVLPLSEYADDWPGNVPKSMLREIEEQTSRLKDLAARLRAIADSI